jgi:hypothetical protein
MKVSIFALIASSLAVGFMSETCDVIYATLKGSPDAIRVNKDDYDADQEKPTGERQYGKYAGKDEPEQSVIGDTSQSFDSLDGVRPQAAPSAPNFTNGEDGTKPVIDEQKGAVAPTVPSANSRLVMKDGNKFFVVDGMGAKLTAEAVGGDIDEDGYKSEKAAQDAIARLPR